LGAGLGKQTTQLLARHPAVAAVARAEQRMLSFFAACFWRGRSMRSLAFQNNALVELCTRTSAKTLKGENITS
jgi:hypothetical protein